MMMIKITECRSEDDAEFLKFDEVLKKQNYFLDKVDFDNDSVEYTYVFGEDNLSGCTCDVKDRYWVLDGCKTCGYQFNKKQLSEQLKKIKQQHTEQSHQLKQLS